MRHPFRPIALLSLALALALSLPLLAQERPSISSEQPRIAVSGHAEVAGKPDTAYVTSGVTSQGNTAREALDSNTADMAALIKALKGAGIEARDIQTSGFSVSPNYVYTDQRDANGYTMPGKINGYTVSNTVSVRIRDLAILGQVLDRSVTVGANTINGISFSVDDPSALYDEARRGAFADARAKATLYAGEAGVGLGPVMSISEQQGYAPPQPYMMRRAADMAVSAPVPVEAGELSFSIDVQVIWTLDLPLTNTGTPSIPNEDLEPAPAPIG